MADAGRFARRNDRGLDRCDGAEARIENQDAPGAKPDQGVGDLGDGGLESRPRQADAARIGDESG